MSKLDDAREAILKQIVSESAHADPAGLRNLAGALEAIHAIQNPRD